MCRRSSGVHTPFNRAPSSAPDQAYVCPKLQHLTQTYTLLSVCVCVSVCAPLVHRLLKLRSYAGNRRRRSACAFSTTHLISYCACGACVCFVAVVGRASCVCVPSHIPIHQINMCVCVLWPNQPPIAHVRWHARTHALHTISPFRLQADTPAPRSARWPVVVRPSEPRHLPLLAHSGLACVCVYVCARVCVCVSARGPSSRAFCAGLPLAGVVAWRMFSFNRIYH